MENQILSTKNLADYLHVSIQTINKMRKNSELPYFRIGTRVFFKKDKINLWIDNQELKNVKNG